MLWNFFLWCLSLVLLCLGQCYALAAQQQQVAVVGASGRLGRQVVQRLVSSQIPCKILLRQPVEVTTTIPQSLDENSSKEEVAAYLANLQGVTVVVGDVTSEETCKELLQDCSACMAVYGATRRSQFSDLWKDVSDTDPTHSKQVNYVGLLNLLRAAAASTACKRIVRITGKGENPESFISILINILGSMAKAWNYQGELALRAQSDVDYTIIRPGIMTEKGPPPGSILCMDDNGADLKVAPIAYEDIAAVCCECLDYPNTARSTLTVMTTTDESDSNAGTLSTLLGRMKPDQRQFPTDTFERHQQAVKKTLVKFFGIGTVAVLGILFSLLL